MKHPSPTKLLSFIVPVFNEEENVDALYDTVTRVMQEFAGWYDYEFVFTDNHSTDATFERLCSLAGRDVRVRVIRFSRNFGYQRSIYAGYTRCRGDAAIQLDCDLQDPPEMIGEFLRHWEAGAKVVYGVRRKRREGWVITSLRKTYYRLLNWLSEDEIPLDAGDFRLVDRCVIEELKRIEDYQPYLRGLIATMGFEQIGIPYDRAPRRAGESKFSFRELASLAVDGILSHSVIPLRLATYTGFAISVVTFLGLVGYVVGKFVFGQEWPAGFATITTLILFGLSLNALFLGVIGEYLGRIYRQVRKQPRTIIEQTVGEETNDWSRYAA